MDHSRRMVIKLSDDENTTQSAALSKMFKRPNHITDHLYHVELVKPENEHKEPINVRFLLLRNATLKLLELCYNFFWKFCDADKCEELEADTDSLYLALSKEDLGNVIPPKTETRGMQCA